MDWWTDWPFDYPLDEEETRRIHLYTTDEINRVMGFIRDNRLWEYFTLLLHGHHTCPMDNDDMIEWLISHTTIHYGVFPWGFPGLATDEVEEEWREVASFTEWAQAVVDYALANWNLSTPQERLEMFHIPVITPAMIEEFLGEPS